MSGQDLVRALIITGYGLNCEAETEAAFRLAGAQAEQVHLNDLLDGSRSLDDFHILAFIGGFAFGDHLGAGTVFATRVKYRMGEDLARFVEEGKLVVGICNGFQTLVKLGLLPGFGGSLFDRSVTLSWNDTGVFRDAWVRVRANPRSPCVFTRGLDLLDLPVRHGEGKFVARDQATLDRVVSENLVALQYADPATGEPTEAFPHNPNGSAAAVAGICNPSGRIFGLMPHPEAYLFPENHPQWPRRPVAIDPAAEGQGVRLFRNAVNFAAENLV